MCEFRSPLRCSRVATRTLLLALPFLMIAAPSFAGNALERAIEKTEPCRSIKGKVDLGLTKVDVGVDRLDYIKIESARIAMDGDAANASARGTLACKTSDSATSKRGFSATAEAHAKINLVNCAVDASSIAIVKTDGTFGDLVEGFKGQIEDALRRGLVRSLTKLCEN